MDYSLPWSKPLARNDDPATSHQAAASVKEVASKHAMMILDALHTHGDLSPTGIAECLGLDRSQVFRRMAELERRGFVYPTGRLLRSPSGRNEREWSFKQG
jgi:DNA-binding MarR family transcriptional regulator